LDIKAMKKRTWSYRTVIRYVLFQLPGTVVLVLLLFLVRQWISIPGWFVWILLALWVIKDAIMFPFVWRAYDKNSQGIAESMIGMQGIARDRMDPSGYILIRGELWHAELIEGASPIDRGQEVRILGNRGFTLLVGSEMK
jgi:membrane-bound ClpP family serine protease